MGIFSRLFGGNNNSTAAVNNSEVQTPIVQSEGILNLNKGDILDLTKYSTSLTNVRAAAGWDVNRGIGHDYDLDLCAYMMSNNRLVNTVFYGARTWTGIYLDGDNLTGSGEGDDENIFVSLREIPSNIDRIVFAVVIYEAGNRHQMFRNVKNAYMRLVDQSNGKEICRYLLTEDGGSNTAATLASLNRNNGNWSFEAIGRYSCDTIKTLGRKI